ncbi:hypothetical protein [Saccharopolyspora taberi]|uniref:ESX-1 secretion-associated protein n=1 Tax=Saccharopolyspora taberi TaxID=60895 RepID=A0ABN3VLV1_9PSEU
MTRSIFSADTHELRATARNTRNTINDFSSRSALKYRLAPSEAGHDRLGAELAAYQQESASAVDLLRADALELADRLVGSADLYEELDAGLADRLSEIADLR